MLIKGENLIRYCSFCSPRHLEMGSSTIIISMREFCSQSSYELLIRMRYCVRKTKGLDLKGVRYNLNCMVGTPLIIK